MKIVVVLSLLACLFCAGDLSAAPRGGEPGAELLARYEARDFFALERRLPSLPADDPQRLFFEGVLASARLRDARAEELLARFLGLPDVTPQQRMEALFVLGNGRLRRGEYAAAARALSEALRGPISHLNAARKLDAEQNLAAVRALAGFPPPVVEVSGTETTLPVTRDGFGLIHFDLQVDGQAERGVFDTLSNANLVSESFARSHRLRMTRTPVAIRAVTGRSVPGRFGMADRVRIGGLVLRNVVFLILPDGSLAAPGAGESAGVVAGLPLLLPMGRARYDSARGTLTIAPTKKPPGMLASIDGNFLFDGLTPLVRVEHQGEPLPFVLDTGAQRTKLLPAFGRRFPRAWAATGSGTLRGRGVGGTDRVEASFLPALALEVGGTTVPLRNVPALPAQRAFLPPVDGTLGMDFLRGGFDLDLSAGQLAVTPPP